MIGLYMRECDGAERLDEIASVYEVRGGKPGQSKYCVLLKGEDMGREITAATRDRIVMHPLQLVPAQAGTYLLRVWLDEGVPASAKTPIIAWALCFDGQVRPVTPQAVNDGYSPDDELYVLMPDGSVQADSEHSDPVHYDDEEAYRLGEGTKLADEAERQRQSEQARSEHEA